MRCLLFTITCILIVGCRGQEELEWPYEKLSLPVELDVRQIRMIDDDLGYAVGGKRFLGGFMAQTKDSWASWQMDSLNLDIVYDIACRDFENCISVGWHGQTLIRQAGGAWNWFQQGIPTRLKAAQPIDEDSYLVMGGHSLSYGAQMVIDNQGTSKFVVDSADFEYEELVKLEDGTFVSSGYGIIQRSENNGDSWDVSQLQGDFFLSLSFPDNNTGFAVGDFGTIARSTDGGKSWEKLRNGNSLFVSDLQFQDVHFWTEHDGMVVGKGGLVWSTEDSGDSWSELNNLPDLDYYTVTSTSTSILVGGEDGTILRLPIEK